MRRELLYTARWDLQTAYWNLTQDDDAAPLCAAYHVSQSVEKILKTCIKEYGLNYTKTHRIEDLLAILPRAQSLISEELLCWLEDNAVTLYEWESKTRYGEGYMVVRRHVQRVYNTATELYAYVCEKLQELDAAAEKDAKETEELNDTLETCGREDNHNLTKPTLDNMMLGD